MTTALGIVLTIILAVFLLLWIALYVSSPKRDERHAKNRYRSTTKQVRDNQELLKKK